MLKIYSDTSVFIGADENTEESIANTIRVKLGIQSRTDLRNNSEAREKFKNITEGFERWKKGYQQ